jgi:hypothetical protein
MSIAGPVGDEGKVKPSVGTEERVMRPIGPDPTVVQPIPDQPRVVLQKPLITSPLIEIGEYSYYDNPEQPEWFNPATSCTSSAGSPAAPGWPKFSPPTLPARVCHRCT